MSRMNAVHKRGKLRSALHFPCSAAISHQCILFFFNMLMKPHVYSCLLQAPSLDEKVILHFIALVNVGGTLYELGELTSVIVCKISHDI